MRTTFPTTEESEIVMAIVRVFETGKPLGNYAACVVLNDGAGISYGTMQFTHRSGSLAAVVEKYLELGGVTEREILSRRLPILQNKNKVSITAAANDAELKAALRSAAATPEMRSAQDELAVGLYLKPSIDECSRMHLTSPLSLAVVYDSMVHGSWERIRDSVQTRSPEFEDNGEQEKAWVSAYVKARHRWLLSIPRLRPTAYRTRFFLEQILRSNWDLRLPLAVNGVVITERTFSKTSPAGPISSADLPQNDQPGPHQTGRGNAAPAETARPATDLLTEIELVANAIEGPFDRTERIINGAIERTDRAKALWTTVCGVIWQAVWAVFGAVAGIPREVWLAAGIIAGLLTLLYLYRQIALGRIREQR